MWTSKKKSLTKDIEKKEYEWALSSVPFTDLEKQQRGKGQHWQMAQK